MSLLDDLKNYYLDEKTLTMFLSHKLFHMATGALSALVMIKMTGSMLLAVGTAFVLGVLKEVDDQIKTAGQYHESYLSSTLDITITTCGGVLGILLSTIVSGNGTVLSVIGLGAVMFITLFIAQNLGGGAA